MSDSRTLLVIPAFNEEGAIGSVVTEVRQTYPNLQILVADDCSRDATVDRALVAGARVLQLPCHLGLGGCVQAAYKLAFEEGYDTVVRIDGDGQHDPSDIGRLLDRLRSTGCEMVIGVRAKESGGLQTHIVRKIGIHFFRLLLRPILGRPVTDPTSGFVAVNERALAVFSASFPLEYPEIETLVVLQRRRFRFEEVPCRMRKRMAGRSSITALKSVYYVIHVLLGVFVNILRFDGRPRKGQG
ncbi:glycosyltransferase family 2 protein [uncultured Paludibaculum sp.]|uniref:glycosyltransferase family 2 protein n=1 Tax=uncultured Paludibaculum sp. TaxID=1765020 RepID=UPI002AAB4620|nr:glycosyltransferase family 2 protein [uncultured Paludibaculum sp.]